MKRYLVDTTKDEFVEKLKIELRIMPESTNVDIRYMSHASMEHRLEFHGQISDNNFCVGAGLAERPFCGKIVEVGYGQIELQCSMVGFKARYLVLTSLIFVIVAQITFVAKLNWLKVFSVNAETLGLYLYAAAFAVGAGAYYWGMLRLGTISRFELFLKTNFKEQFKKL